MLAGLGWFTRKPALESRSYANRFSVLAVALNKPREQCFAGVIGAKSRLKKFNYSPFESLLKEIILFLLVIIFIFFTSSVLLSKEQDVQLITSTGRAVIIDNDIDLAKKRALDDALYLASLQGGAKINGYSSIDSQSNLKENLVVRPSSEIIDFSAEIIDSFN